MKNILLKFITLIAFANISFCQDLKKTEAYFKSFKDGKAVHDLCFSSFPTLEDCKKVFKDSSAYDYLEFIEKLKIKMKEKGIQDSSVYSNIRVEFFTVKDIELGKGNYAGGMQRILDKLIPGQLFYEVNFLRNPEDEYGMAYKYWIFIDDRWVFFPKPWQAFRD